jgi:hypothetical protein
MRLFVGLGNPGARYAANRHNIGFMAVDEIARQHRFAPWRSRFQGQISEGTLGAERVMLLKPQTFMNESGQSVGEAMRFFKLGLSDISVFHDELDLAPAKMRVKIGGGRGCQLSEQGAPVHGSPWPWRGQAGRRPGLILAVAAERRTGYPAREEFMPEPAGFRPSQ